MKLEKYTKQSGAFLRPKYKETIDTEISEFKGTRAISVSEITIESTLENGETHTFDGDETSQNRLSRAGWGIQQLGIPTLQWKTYNNDVVELTVTDIATILVKAGQAQTAVWF